MSRTRQLFDVCRPLKYVSSSATVGGSHYWNSGYVQTGGQFKQLGEGAKEVRVLYPDSLKTREKFLVFFGLADSARRMIRGGFLTEEDRGKLVALVRDGSAASRVTRRANALGLLGGGWG